MGNSEFLYAFLGVVVVVLAVVAAWIELRVEEREQEQEPRHRRVLKQSPRYREHVARALRTSSGADPIPTGDTSPSPPKDATDQPTNRHQSPPPRHEETTS